MVTRSGVPVTPLGAIPPEAPKKIPADLGPASSLQLLDEPGKAEDGDLMR